jgi:hypothetical protein
MSKYGEEYWALWSHEFVELSKTTPNVHVAMAESRGITPKVSSTYASRMRQMGFLAPNAGRNMPAELGERSERALKRMSVKPKSRVAIDVIIEGETKGEALAKVWDLVHQLEAWDDRTGERFVYKPRLET